MFPDEIRQILNKYQNYNEGSIQNINKNINIIITEFKIINANIANQLNKLVIDKNTNNNAEELLKDSIALRDYINSINLLEFEKTHKNNTTKILEESLFVFDKMVFPYLVSDDLCPFCNVKLIPHLIYYQRNLNNQLLNDEIEWNKCPNCKRLFVLDYDAEAFNFDNTNITLNKDKYDEIPLIDIYSVIVLNNTLKCSLNHRSKDLMAKIPVLNESGQISYLKISASYCFDCERFTILKDDFNAIKDVVMCKVIDETSERQSNNYDMEMGQKQSILYNYGYNVQTKKNLSEQQRRIILSSVIEANIMNRRDVVNHISTLIERGNKISSWKDATQKWKTDRKFVSEYQSECLPEVIFNNIILKYKKSI
ncbi:hypothetical protein [Lacrimispora sp.]|uniref:hypothetical protein n=1 Tax=Lacrimispora sp. TaxID=2719234 RepID=UPI0028A8C316|nr:hypothetical protein [Lacrimispora sp.]